MRVLAILIVLAIAIYFIVQNLTVPKTVGLLDGKLQGCPERPNCVSCQAKDSNYIAPLPYTDTALDQIQQYLVTTCHAQIVQRTPTYLHAVVTSKIFRFKDDLEFLAEPERQQICVRSAARVGYSDMGVNRERVEKLRENLKQY